MKHWVWRVGLVLWLCGLATIASAQAGNMPAARDHYAKGAKLHALGHFDEAVKEFEAAYEAYADPVFLYNIAQDHRLAGHNERALFFYKSYLAHKPNAANVAEVATRIADLQKVIDAEEAQKQQAEAEAKRQALARQQADDEARRQREAEAARIAAQASAAAMLREHHVDLGAARRKRIAGIAAGAAGVALLAVGLACNGLAAKATNDLHDEATTGGTFDPSVQSRGRAFNVVGPVFDVLGGAAIVSGIVLYAIGHRDETRARRLGEVAWTGNGARF